MNTVYVELTPMRKRNLHFFISLLLASLGSLAATAQQAGPSDSTLGESVYKIVSEAIFAVEVLDENGNLSASGTAFVVENQRLVTNHHVVRGGKPYIRVGKLRVECTVESVDPINDLALLSIAASIEAPPLILSQRAPAAGATIFAIGNPAGLERTITQGLVSGRREIEGQSLIQISASISPGSSGGPVVDPRGEVVGVAVGYLRDGQNLNFAVPTEAVTKLLQQKAGTAPNLEDILIQVANLDEERSSLDLADYEQWGKTTETIEALLQRAQELAQAPGDRLAVAELASLVFADKIAIEAARKAIQGSPANEMRARRILANCLWRESWLPEAKNRGELLSEALNHAKITVEKSSKPTTDDLTLLASILESTPGRRAEAFARFQQALAAARKENELSDLRPYFRGLFRTSKDLAEASAWFKEIADHGGAEESDWVLLAKRGEEAENPGFAGEAWARAAELDPSTENLCSAGFSFWRAEQLDRALASFRRCTEVAALEKDSESSLAGAYSAMSAILFDRGVYDQSVTYAKQSIGISPEIPWPYLNLSRGLNALGRNLEAVTAAEQAIRLSDGKYSDMHFALGTAYFDLKDWARSARAFQKAAELEPQDAASAYNVALCLQRQSFYLDAAKWYEEVLRRNPGHPDRDEILRRIRGLRQ